MRALKRAALAAATALLAATLPAAQADAVPPGVVVGASGQYQDLRDHGIPVDAHLFQDFGDSIDVSGRLLGIDSTTRWSQVSGGAIDADIRRWADAVAASGVHKMVIYSHEPMVNVDGGGSDAQLGTAAQFKTAWQHVVSVFNQRGATDVEWWWDVTMASWTVAGTDPKSAPKWYPGDTWVDVVSTKSYDYGACKNRAPQSFAAGVGDALPFAQSHGKRLGFAEFGHSGHDGRVPWMNGATTWMDNHRPILRGAFYYDSPFPTGTCQWVLSETDEYTAMANMLTTVEG